MFNKNDPLIGVVQQVMQKSNAERDAVKAVNEKFGVQDRKALPHEKQSEWTAAYNQILSEELKGNQHKIDANENGRVDGGDFPLLKKGVRPMKKAEELEEKAVNPYAVGMAAVKKSTGDEPPMEKKNIVKAHKIAKKIIAKKKMNEGFNNHHDSSVTASADKQVVVDQLNEKVGVPLAARQKQQQVRKDAATTQQRLAREPNEAPSSIGTKIKQGLSATNAAVSGFANQALLGKEIAAAGDYAVKNIGAAVGIGKGTTYGQEYKQEQEKEARMKLNNPTAYGVGDAAGNIANIASAAGLVKSGLKYGAKKVIGSTVKSSADDAAKVAATSAKPATTAASTAKTTQQSVPSVAKGSGQANRLAAPQGPGAGKGPWGTPNTPAAQAASQAVKKNTTARVSAIRREVPGAQSVKPSAPVTPKTQSGVPSIAQGKGRVGPSKVERTGPWNPVGPKAPAKPPGAAPNAAGAAASKLSARQRFAQTAKDIRAGVGKVASDRPLQAAAVGGAALGIAKATQPKNTPAPASAALAKQQSTKIGNQTGGVGSGVNTSSAKTQPAAKPVTAKPASAAPAVNKPVVTAKPKVNPLQSKTQRDDISGPSGTGKVVGGVTSGKVTGKTITNKPQVAKKAPVGTGRVK